MAAGAPRMSERVEKDIGSNLGGRAKSVDGHALVWDLPVRLIHWLLVLAVIGSYTTHRMGLAWFRCHAWFGYATLLLVATRILWGFVGTKHAQFGSFLVGPGRIWKYVRAWRSGTVRHIGHNPLGALMVLLLLLLLLAQSVTGLFANDQISNAGPLFGYVSNNTSDELSSWHHRIFNFLLAAIALHVFAVLIYRVIRRENLVTPMITGRRSGVPSGGEIERSRTWLALLILLLLAAALALIIWAAPVASLSIF
jgi:cytochrome b